MSLKLSKVEVTKTNIACMIMILYYPFFNISITLLTKSLLINLIFLLLYLFILFFAFFKMILEQMLLKF